MRTFVRRARLLGIALTMAAILSGASEKPGPVYAGCGADVGWGVSSTSTSRQTSDTAGGATTGTSDYSSTSVQVSSDGQTYTSNQSSHTNADGSSSSHEEDSYSDQFGNGCNSDGEPFAGSSTTDEETDKDGNRKEHHEEITEKNGKCEKTTRDREWDRRGNLKKDTGFVTTEIPCSKYNLEWKREGGYSIPGATMQFGPDTAVIPLVPQGGAFDVRTYVGSQKGTFHATATMIGGCSGTYTYPVSAQVNAKEDEFDRMKLEFSVTTTVSEEYTIACPSGTSSGSTPPMSSTRTFTLEAEDGASWSSSVPIQGGKITDTFTIKKRNPQK